MLAKFLSLAADSPDAAAVIDSRTGRVASRKDLLLMARALREHLRQEGFAEGDALLLQLPNSAAFVAAVLAAFELRLLLVPADRDASDREIAVIRELFSVRGMLRMRGGAIEVTSSDAPRPAVPSGALLLKLTSGSTGRPKGIVTTEANLAADCSNICASMEIAPDDVNLGAIPFSHSYGFSNLVMPLLMQGTAVVVTDDYLPQHLLDIAHAYRCTVAPLIPMVYQHLAAAASGRFETVRTFLSAGAPLPATTAAKFLERFGQPIHSFYGCSECGGISYDRRGNASVRGTVGSAMDGVTLSIEETRLTVRSDAVAAGYLIDATTFEPFLSGTYRTDDLVAVSGDELQLIGRASDLINSAGKKVNPREVESVVREFPGVRDVRAYGEPAGARGDVVAVVIAGASDLSRTALREFCASRLAAHKVPRIIKLVEQLPVDARGKTTVAKLREA